MNIHSSQTDCTSHFPKPFHLLLLLLLQGIDVARHLPSDALADLMGVAVSSGVQLSTVCVSSAKPFEAALTAKIPNRDSEPSSSSSSPSSSATSVPPFSATGDGGDFSAPKSPSSPKSADIGADGSGGQVAGEYSGRTSAAASPPADGEGGGVERERERGGELLSPIVAPPPFTTGSGRPRVVVSKQAVSKSAFEALGLALRYPATRIYVRTELLAAAGGRDGEAAESFDASDVPDLYPNLMKLGDARTRRSAADEMDAQFEVSRIRQQLESAVSLTTLDCAVVVSIVSVTGKINVPEKM